MADPTQANGSPRSFNRDGSLNVVRLGRRPYRGDAYHRVLNMPWGWLMLASAGFYVATNFVFALAYLLTDGVANAAPGDFADAFFFSVQTLATIGYGVMYPKTVMANTLVTLETICGMLIFSLTTGLMFARFARPNARVMFSRHAVLTTENGRATLKFRCANQRSNQLYNAEIKVVLIRTEFDAEGRFTRRLHDLALVRDRAPFFALSLTVMHMIDATSPLFETTEERLRAEETEIVALIAGTDDTFNQVVHGRASYGVEDILFGYRLVDIIGRLPDGRLSIDYSRFDAVEPVAPDAAVPRAAGESAIDPVAQPVDA